MHFVLMPPATESLLRLESQGSPWPEEIRNDPDVKKDAEFRVRLGLALQALFENKTLISPKMAIEVYDGLAALLESDPDSRRLVFYIPFELLSDATGRWSESGPLAEAASRFKKVYMTRWYELLEFADVRANFVDGDIPEVELRTEPLQRVIKAVHLIPKLVQAQFLSIADVIQIVRESGVRTLLSDSLTDILPVLVDFGFLSQRDLNQICHENQLELGRERKKDVPATVTPAREKWLQRRAQEASSASKAEKMTPSVHGLGVSFSSRAEGLRKEAEIFDGLIASIQTHAELSRYLYPVVIFFGSRLKGYGRADADLDYAVFVRPGVHPADRAKIQNLLAEVSPKELADTAVEFWLELKPEGDADELRVTDFPNPDKNLASSNWVHVLFNGAWYGDESSIKELHQKVLVGYLFSKEAGDNETDDEITDRMVWLEQMEKDALQYRLMHSGYDRYFPDEGRIKTAHSRFMDGDTTFFDSGFRRLATRLFVANVLLPRPRYDNRRHKKNK